MEEDHSRLVRQVCEAKKDMAAADRLIREYLPFIKTETAKYLKRPPVEGNDDELSIAMIAFHEAILRYSKSRGAFLPYASVLIKNRLIDYTRKEKKHRGILSIETPAGDNGDTIGDQIPCGTDRQEELVERDATQKEIEELSRQMEQFGISLTDVANNCPRQKRTLKACQKVLAYARGEQGLLEELLRTRRLPIARLAEGSKVERKTLERHRKYLIALLLIYTNGYEIIRGHLKQVMKGGAAG